MILRTWMAELGAVALVLATVSLATGNAPIEWLGSCAVLASFAHGQVSDRLAEREAKKEQPEVGCWRWLLRYYVAKEGLWLLYFVAHRSWSALVGVAVFLAYPFWRRGWRRLHPVNA